MTKTFDTLYARDSRGSIVDWTVSVHTVHTHVDIKLSYGAYTGAKTLTWQRGIKGKNIGKANETNAYEQAILEAESLIRRKKKKGYMSLEEIEALKPVNNDIGFNFIDANEGTALDTTAELLSKYLPKYRTDADGDVKPMKAQQYYRSAKDKTKDENGKSVILPYWTDPEGNRWDDRKYYYLKFPYKKKGARDVIPVFPCMGQPKINGVRATIKLVDNKVVIKSKEGLLYNIPQVSDFLTINSDIFTYGDVDLVLDGELYIHNEPLQIISSAVKSTNLDSQRIVFILFDLAIPLRENLERWNIIKEHIKPKLEASINTPIEIIKTTVIDKESTAQAFTDWAIKQGYEGSIFRDFTSEYGFGTRQNNMVKLKRVIEEEFLITSIVPQAKDPTKGNFTCITKEGLYFDVTPKGTEDFKREILASSSDYIGKKLTCTFYEWTEDKKPYHIITNIVRDYE